MSFDTSTTFNAGSQPNIVGTELERQYQPAMDRLFLGNVLAQQMTIPASPAQLARQDTSLAIIVV